MTPETFEYGWTITCPQCNRTSYHTEDVRHRFCGACKIYHDAHPEDRRSLIGTAAADVKNS
jgi:hypothetical protein